MRSRSAKSRYETSRINGRIRTASDDSDLTSSLIRKHSHGSMTDSAYSEGSAASSFSTYKDKSSSDKLLSKCASSESDNPSAFKLKSGEMIERL